MLSLIVIFFIGKYFYELAQDFYKSRWLFGLLGILTYFAGATLGVILFDLSSELNDDGLQVGGMMRVLLSELVSGTVLSTVLYVILYVIWNKKEDSKDDDIDDIGRN